VKLFGRGRRKARRPHVRSYHVTETIQQARRSSGLKLTRRKRATAGRRRPRGRPFWQVLRLPRLRLTPRLLASLGGGVALLGAVAAFSFLRSSSNFVVTPDTATVRGNQVVPAEDIFAASRLDGQNLFRVNARQAEAAIAQLPFIKRAHLSLVPPNRVAIAVEERQPAAAWLAGGGRYWVDEEGVILPEAGDVEGVLTIHDKSETRPDNNTRVDGAAVRAAVRLRQWMPELSEVELWPDKGVTIVTAQGWPVHLGNDADRLSREVALLNALLPELVRDKAQVEYIDLRFDRPYYKLKPAPEKRRILSQTLLQNP
jgi:cell division septal protein FtsQ